MISVENTKSASSTPAATTASTTATTAGGSRFAETLRSVQHRGRDLDPIFAKAAATYGVPQELLRAIAFHESGFQTDAVSHAGAMGLMQLMPVAAQAMGVSDPFDPEQNVMGGAKLLGQYLEKYDGNLKLTLAAYGAGCGSVAKYNGIPPYKETQNFVADIMSVVHAGGLPAWDHTGAPTAVFSGAQAPAMKMAVTPASVTATAAAMPPAANPKAVPDSGRSPAVSAATIAAAPMPESVVADASAKTKTVPASSADMLPAGITTASSVTAAQIFTKVSAASAVIASGAAGAGVTTPTSAVVTAAELAAENLATLLAANASEQQPKKSDEPNRLLRDIPDAPPANDAFRTALVRGLSSIGTGNISSMQTVFFAQKPSSEAMTELFQQIEAFDGFTEEDYRLLVASLLADMDKKPSEGESAPPFYLNM